MNRRRVAHGMIGAMIVSGWLHGEGHFIPDWGYAPRSDGGGRCSSAHLLLRDAYLSMATARDPIDYISRLRRGVVPPNPTWTLKVTELRTEAAA